MILKDNTASHSRNQVEKNKWIHKKTPSSNFLTYCSEYALLVVSEPSSPWKKNKNPLYNLKKYGIKQLGKTQKKVIYFLYDFFKKGKPVYFNYKTLAKQLDINPTNISKVLTSLEERQLIIKENFKAPNKGGQHQVVLIPDNPDWSSNFQDFLGGKLLHQNKESYFTKQTKILCKYSKTKKNLTSNSLLTVNTIGYFKNLYGLKRKLKLSLQKQENPSASGEDFSVISLKEKKVMRLNLKRKETLIQGKNKHDIADKFKKRKKSVNKDKIIEELSVFFESIKTLPKNQVHIDLKTINRLNTLVELEYGFEYNIKDLFDFRRIDSPSGLLSLKIFVRLFDIIKNNRRLELMRTAKIINYFNSKKDVRFTRTDPNKSTKMFRRLVITITYYLQNHSMDDIFRAIDRLEKYKGCTTFRFKNKIHLLEFLNNPKDDAYLKVFFTEENDKAIFSVLNKVKTKFPKEQNYWYKLYINLFSDPDDGKEQYRQYQYKMGMFIESLMRNITEHNLDLCDYTVTESADSAGSILKMYMAYMQHVTGNKIPKILDLTNDLWFDKFVVHKMRDEEEQTGFFRPVFRKKTRKGHE